MSNLAFKYNDRVVNTAKPVLKWAGGKSQLLSQLNELLPPKLKVNAINTYIEPFVGGGAMFFNLCKMYDFKNVYLFDTNRELIILYNAIKHDVKLLIEELNHISNEYFITEDFEFHKKWLELCKRVLKPNGTLWVSGTYHSIYSCGFAMLLLDYHILNDISWFKPNASPNLSCKYFTASHESLIWARKNKTAKHYFNYEAMKDGDFPKDFIKKPHTQMRSVWAISTPQSNEKIFGKQIIF